MVSKRIADNLKANLEANLSNNHPACKHHLNQKNTPKTRTNVQPKFSRFKTHPSIPIETFLEE